MDMPPPTAAASAKPFALHVSEHALKPEGYYVEGAIRFVVVRNAAQKIVLKRRFTDLVRLGVGLPAGKLRVTSFARPCDGNCGYLDPPTDKCSVSLDAGEGGSARFTLQTKVAEPCKFIRR